MRAGRLGAKRSRLSKTGWDSNTTALVWRHTSRHNSACGAPGTHSRARLQQLLAAATHLVV